MSLPPSRPAAVPPDTALRVYVVTMGPGAEVWERFGHVALWVEDPADGTSIAYNYGMFSFQQENFLLRFVQGRMWYWMAGYPAVPYIDTYVQHDRSVWVQELALPLAARRELRDFLAWNARDENKYYFYDYYRDNCATRVRDAIDRVIGGRLRAATDTAPSGTTYRWHTARLTGSDLPIYAGIMFGLGEPTDRTISEWEEMFLPLKLRDRLNELTVPGPDGRPTKLVQTEYAVHASRTFADPGAPPNMVPPFLVAGVLLGGLVAWLGRRAAAARRAGRPRRGVGRWFAGVAALWMFLAGVAGVIVTLLWAATDHHAAYRNENLFLANLLALPLVVVLPRLAAGAPWAARAARRLALVVAGLAALGLVAKLLPGFSQHNGEMIALMLPVHLGVLAGVWWLAAAVEATTAAPPLEAVELSPAPLPSSTPVPPRTA